MNILLLCTYPIKEPRHGGQLRVRNIVDAYAAMGHNVEVVGVLGSEQYAAEDGFLPFPGTKLLAGVLPNYFLMEDYAIGCLYSQDTQHYNRLIGQIKTKPDVIHVEQPWLFSFAQRYAASINSGIKILYGSQNIEWHLKQSIVSSYLDEETARQNMERVLKIELEAIKGSHAIACVSENDAQWLKSQTNTPVVLAPNGVKSWQSTDEGRKEAVAVTKGYRYALYCASAHPPNITGFFDMLAGGFGSLKPDEKLVVAGGAGWSIAGDTRVHQSAKLAEKVIVAGMVSQPCLEALLTDTHCIILPLTQGGGTNLKTAEALWAGKHIIATSIAMRGFENFIGSRGIYVADDSVGFKRGLRLAMEADPLKLTEDEINCRRTVLWEDCLKPLMELMTNLTEGSST